MGSCSIAALAAIAVTAIPWVTPPAHGATMLAMSLGDLVTASDTVVVAHTTTRRAQWNHGRIVTVSQVQVDIAVAGWASTGSTLSVRTLGGVVDDIGQVVPGEASLPVGRPYVLFLRPPPRPNANASAAPSDDALVIAGMSQGALPVVTGSDQKLRIGESAVELDVVGRPKDGEVARVALRGRLLDDVLSEIRARWAAKAPK